MAEMEPQTSETSINAERFRPSWMLAGSERGEVRLGLFRRPEALLAGAAFQRA